MVVNVPRVLSIQSHVVCGYVGNKAATFPLQYVPETLLQVYKNEIIPFADLITPNQFEAELLSGVKINTENDAIEAMDRLHDLGTKTVVITSSEIGNDDQLILLASKRSDQLVERVRLPMPKLDSRFTGTGDLFSSMLLAWMSRHPDSLKTACEKTVSATHLVLRRTMAAIKEKTDSGEIATSFQRELRLIESLEDIRCPSVLFTAEEIKN
eukprot:gene26-616_t